MVNNLNIFSFTVDGFRILQFALTVFIFAVSLIFTKQYGKVEKLSKYHLIVTLFTLTGTLGVFFSANFLTMFFFFEIMSFASYGWVAMGKGINRASVSNLYLYFSLVAGMVMLMGLFLLEGKLGTLEFSEVFEATKTINPSELFLPCALVLVGFATKAGLVPLHAWQSKTYCQAPAPFTAVFSAILSKTGVFGALMLSVNAFYHQEDWGKALLIIAIITMLYGGICAIASVDMKRTIAYSSMSQIGFIFTGVAMIGVMGDHNTIASLGTVWHMLNHSIFKLILFSLCSVIFVAVGSTKFTKIKGIARKNPIIAIFFLTAACGLGGIPMLSGYISKTLLHESLVEHIHLHPDLLLSVCEKLFIVAGGLTVAYMLKIAFVLFAKNENAPKVKIPIIGTICLFLCVVSVVAMGVNPQYFSELLIVNTAEVMNAHADILHVHYFNLVNLSGAGYSFIVGILVYFFIVRVYLNSEDRKPVYFKFNFKIIPLPLAIVCEFLSVKFVDILFKVAVTPLIIACEFFSVTVVDILFKIVWFTFNSVAMVLGNFVEFIMKMASVSLFRPSKEKDVTLRISNSYKFGNIFDKIVEFIKHKSSHKFAEKFDSFEKMSNIRRRMITSSLSYGLMFSGLGIIAVLFYLMLS